MVQVDLKDVKNDQMSLEYTDLVFKRVSSMIRLLRDINYKGEEEGLVINEFEDLENKLEALHDRLEEELGFMDDKYYSAP